MTPKDKTLLETIARVRINTRLIDVIDICDRCAELIIGLDRQPAALPATRKNSCG